MTGLRRRNRLVNFRLTEKEYGRLAEACALKGSPSISDFTRGALLRTVEMEAESRHEPVETATLLERLHRLERCVEKLAEAHWAERREDGPERGST